MSLRSEVIRIFNELMGQGKKISELPAGASPSGTELIEAVQGGQSVSLTVNQVSSGGVGVTSVVAGTNVTVDNTDPQNPIVSATGGGGSGTVESVTGDGVDNTDPDNPILTFPTPTEIGLGNVNNTSDANKPISTATQTALDLKEALYRTFDRKTGNYGLVLTDQLKGIEMNVAGANTVTVPLNATQAFPVGSLIPVVQYGAGLTSIVATGGVTINTSAGNLDSPGQYSPMFLRKIATDEWYLWNGTAGGGGGGTWGSITGTLSAQTDLQSALDAKQDDITFGTGVQTALGVNVGSTGAPVLFNGAGGTPSAITLTNGTGLPIASGVSGLGSNVAAFLATPSSANLAAAVTDEVGAGSLVLSEPDVNVQTGSYTLVLADKAKEVRMNVAGSNNLTVPLNATVAFPTGTLIVLTQYGAGTTSVVATGGVTINTSAGNLLSPGQYSPMILRKIGTDEWYLWNGASAVTAALTRTNGTYITITLGGSPSGALNTAVDITAELTGVVPLTLGGTGASSATQTYTPTLTNTANVAASTPRACQYMRVGNTVTVSGQLDIDPTTTATLTTLGISLPIASAFTTAFQLGGTAAAIGVADAAAGIQADATNDRAMLQYVCTDVTNHTMTFTFTYQVL